MTPSDRLRDLDERGRIYGEPLVITQARARRHRIEMVLAFVSGALVMAHLGLQP